MKQFRYLLIWLFLIPISGEVLACTCKEITIEQAYKEADVVFYGKVISADLLESGEPNEKGAYLFEVKGHFKGRKNAEEIVLALTDGAMCGIKFDLAGFYLVFARKEGGLLNKEIYTGLCMGNRGYGRQRTWPKEVRDLRDKYGQ